MHDLRDFLTLRGGSCLLIKCSFVVTRPYTHCGSAWPTVPILKHDQTCSLERSANYASCCITDTVAARLHRESILRQLMHWHITLAHYTYGNANTEHTMHIQHLKPVFPAVHVYLNNNCIASDKCKRFLHVFVLCYCMVLGIGLYL